MLLFVLYSLALHCDIVYADIGSNNGDTIANFITKKTEASLNKLLLDDFKFEMKNACVLGFEPNPRWTHRLNRIKQEFENNVSSLYIHTSTAAVAHEDEKSVNLYIDDSRDNVGASIYARRSSNAKTINGIQLSSYLHEYLAKMERNPVVLIRMDVEGYEYILIPQLLFSGVLQQFKTHFMIEWHRYLKKLKYYKNLDYVMNHFNRAPLCSMECSSLYQNLEKILTYMIHMSGARTIESKQSHWTL